MQFEAVALKDILPHITSKKTYLRRVAYAGIAVLIVAIGGAGVSTATARQQSAIGGRLFDAILWAVLITGVVECTLLGATAVSSERQRNTVDFWIIAGMEHFGVVLAKAASVLARTFTVVLGPIVPGAVALYLGGRTITDAAVGILAVLSIMIFTASLSVAVSTFCRRNSDAVPAAIATCLGFAVAPAVGLSTWAAARTTGSAFAGAAFKLHPFALLMSIGRARGAASAPRAFFTLALSVLVSTVLLTAAGAHLRGTEAKRTARRGLFRLFDRWLEAIWPWFFHLFKPEPGNPDADPVLWRERVSLSSSRGVLGGMTITDKLLCAAAGVIVLVRMPLSSSTGAGLVNPASYRLLVALLLVCGLVFVYKLSFLVRTSQAFSREFESGHMNLLRLTRLTGSEIVGGKLRAYIRHYSPMILPAVPWVAVLALDMVLSGSYWKMGTLTAVGIHWAWAVGWALSGAGLAALALMMSLYFSSGTKAMFAAILVGMGPAFAVFVLSMPFIALPFVIRMAVQVIIGLIIVLRVFNWSRGHRGYMAKAECLMVAILGSFGAALSGPIVGPLVLYLIASTLMRMNFDSLVVMGVERHPAITRRVFLSYEHRGAFAFTHLGVPPSVERRLRPNPPGPAGVVT